MTCAVGWSPDDLIIDRFGILTTISSSARGSPGLTISITSKGEYPLDHPKHPDHLKSYVQDYLAKYGARKVEANALVTRPEAGRELCRQAILKYVPANAPARYLKKLKPFRARASARDRAAAGGGRVVMVARAVVLALPVPPSGLNDACSSPSRPPPRAIAEIRELATDQPAGSCRRSGTGHIAGPWQAEIVLPATYAGPTPTTVPKPTARTCS